MSKIYAVQGDSLPLVTLTITDLDDNLVSIAGCTGASAYMRKLGETATQTIVTTVDAGALPLRGLGQRRLGKRFAL